MEITALVWNLKVLLTADPFLPVPPKLYGGIERIVASLIDALRARGHAVGLVARAGSSVAVDFFCQWRHDDPEGAFAHAQNAMLLREACNDFGASFVHSFSRLLYLGPLLLRKLPKIMSYQRFPGGAQIALSAAAGRQSLVFTGCSEFIANMGRRYGGTWHAIPNFVNMDIYTFRSEIPDGAPLVFLGRVEPIKGAHIAIEVAKRTGRRLLIAGNHSESGADGEYWDALIKPHLGQHDIEYVGPVDDAAKNELLGSAAAMIAPIQWDEPFGIVFAEALACGTPIITCPRGAAPEIIRDGIEGFLVRDVAEGCQAVHRLATIDRRVCRERAEQSFSVAAVVPKYEGLYKELLQSSRETSTF